MIWADNKEEDVIEENILYPLHNSCLYSIDIYAHV